MINRILIRIKVVQMLYSYFLTRSEFRIEGAPEKKTRDSQYAYTVYLQTLLLILKLSGCQVTPSDTTPAPQASGKKSLTQSLVAEALASNNDLREAVVKRGVDVSIYNNMLQYLLDKITESAVFTDYAKKRKREIGDEVKMWCVVIENILAKDELFKETSRKNPDFTIAGMERGLALAVESLRNYNDIRSTLVNARRSLDESLAKAYQLYYALLMLPVEITRLHNEQLEQAKEKYLPTDNDLNPNLRMTDNQLVKLVEGSEEVAKFLKANPLSWEGDYYMIKQMLDDILQSDIYRKYIAEPTPSFESDCEFWRNVMREIILPSDALAEALEARSVYWNDDINIVGTFTIKTIRRTASSANHTLALYPMFKDEEDEEFGRRLFTDAIDHGKEYRKMIDRHINESNWDSDRLALMDIVIITMALSEIINFPLIPIPVSLNEYIEIANYYSTPHSGQFINGMLYSLIKELIEEGRVHKEFETR